MGAITLAELPRYLDKWEVRYQLDDGWLTRGRKSGGFEEVLGIGVHHGASAVNSTLASARRYCVEVATDRPIGNGTFSRDKDGPILLLWAGLAANTLGKGGPRLSTRGVIPLDSGNSRVVNYEAENNGVGEPWSDAMCSLMVRTCCATLEWANAETPGVPLGPGDVFGHFEWAPGRKFDPAGPSMFNGRQAGPILWDMDLFRGEVFRTIVAAVPSVADVRPDPLPDHPLGNGTPNPTLGLGDASGDAAALVDVLRFWGWCTAPNRLRIEQAHVVGIHVMQSVLGIEPTGVYDPLTARKYSEFAQAMSMLACALPQASSPGDRSTEVHALQYVVKVHGWYPYNLDGQYGPRTQQAVQQLQRHLRGVGLYAGPIDGIYSVDVRAGACQAGM